MARETKLGMLVGLGFIICFAIILENRGQRDQVSPQMPHDMLAQSQTPPSATASEVESRARDYARRNSRPVHEPASATRLTSTTNRQTPAEPTTPTPAGRRNSQGRAMNPVNAAPPQPPPPAAQTRQDPAQSGRNDRFISRQTVQGMDPDNSGAVADTIQPRSADSVTAPPPATTGTVTTAKPDHQAATGRRYQVQAGDTLSHIARRHYGSRSKRIIDAIFDANRGVMSSPNDLRAGLEIVLPEIEGATPQISTPPVESAQPATRHAEAKPTQEYRYYQVQKGDLYATIAKEQLGDASRWKEIAELNRDIFPDPSKIRYGVRIRLPADGGGEKGRRS